LGLRSADSDGSLLCVHLASWEARIASSTSRESVTCVEVVSASGSHIPPMVILAASQHSEAWVKNDLDKDTLIAVPLIGFCRSTERKPVMSPEYGVRQGRELTFRRSTE
ncbi:hypothetical protein A4X03_0g9253, partial [Tilletia caries]